MGELGPTVLIAEDEVDQREILTEILEAEGYRVTGARSPAELLEGLSRAPSVVLLDIHGMAEPEVLRELQLAHPRPALVLLSGDSRTRELAHGLGAEAFLLKPFELDHLLEVLRAVVGRGAKGRPGPPEASSWA